jgi:hypothetical protein
MAKFSGFSVTVPAGLTDTNYGAPEFIRSGSFGFLSAHRIPGCGARHDHGCGGLQPDSRNPLIVDFGWNASPGAPSALGSGALTAGRYVRRLPAGPDGVTWVVSQPPCGPTIIVNARIVANAPNKAHLIDEAQRVVDSLRMTFQPDCGTGTSD